ncbi:hypothetical protein ACWDKQ_36405, partial [Saccharopolyspora sp. NPDC000995]
MASGQQDAEPGTVKRVRRFGEDKERLKEWVVRAQKEGGAETAAAGLKWVNEQGLVIGKTVWGEAWLAATGKARQVRRFGEDKERLKEWVVRAQKEGGAETAAAGLKWVNEQGLVIGKTVWGEAWLAATGKAKQVQRPGIDKERLNEWVVRAQEEGGARTAAAGLKWVNGQGLGVKAEKWGDAWLAATGKAKQVQRPGIERERLNEWVVLSQKVGGAKTVEAGLDWVNGQGFEVEKNVWGEAWLGLEVLDHWSADFGHEDVPFAWEGFDGVGERNVAGDLD